MNIDTKKVEKLASATYLLTSFFADVEPMKWRLRELVGKLISSGENRTLILEISSLLSVAKNVGLISDTNFNIIHPEFLSLISQSQTLGELFKKIEEPKPREVSSLYIASSLPKSVSKPEPVIKDKIKESLDDGVVAMKKNGRQDTILNLLKRKREIMIKDVTPLINGVSEKTIQRELLAMVLSGILKKEGEKRWSRYSLAQ